jgi:hypothetical protein
MGRPRCLGRWLSMLVVLGLTLAPVNSGAVAGTTAPTAAADSPAGKHTGKASRKRKRKKAISRGKPAPTRTKLSRAMRPKALRDPGHTINDDVEITPFPSHAAAARKALSQNRRDQLDDAEKAARDPQQADRWQTVLFHLRAFDSRVDAEACFWRVVAYYRLGEIGRARTIRQNCEIAAADLPTIEKEDAQSASLQPATALPELVAAGERAPAPVPNPAGYEGSSPTHLER